MSVENSEDGAQPLVADQNTAAPTVNQGVYAPQAQTYFAQNVPNPTAPSSMPSAGGGMVYAPGQPVPDAKRRRMNHPSGGSTALGPVVTAAGGVGATTTHQMHLPHTANSLSGARAPHLGMPMLAVAGVHPGALLTGQQLAAAAAQAMQAQGHGGGRKKSQAQIDRRRERNRILARRTRLRKKFFFESLQKEVLDLQKENVVLKELVKTNLPETESQKLLDECNAMEQMPPSVLESLGEVHREYDQKDFNLVKSIQTSQHAFIITDPSLPDNPIVFASDDFLQMTGYKREQVLGRNCRFLQGPDTSKGKLDEIKRGLKEGEDVSVTFVNYTADGTPFWNKLFIAALRDAQNNIVNYIGVTVKVAGPLPDDPEHGKAVAGMEGSGSVATAAIGGESTQEGGDATGAAPGQQSPGQIPSEP